MSDRRVTALVLGGTARVLVVSCAGVVQETVKRHKLGAQAVRIAADLVVANTLLALWIKGDERVTLQLQSEAPKASFLGEVDAYGQVRARFKPGWLDGEGTAVNGLLFAVKANATEEMYRGVTAVEGETIGAALERHLRQSDQVPAHVRIAVDVPIVKVERAVGLVLERLPIGGEAEDRDFETLASKLGALDAAAILAGLDSGSLAGEPLDVIDELPLQFRCRCGRPKVESMLLGLGPDTLRAMRDEDHGAEITCHFCSEVYRFEEAELDRLLGQLVGEA